MKLSGEIGAWLAGVWGKSWSKMLTLVSLMVAFRLGLKAYGAEFA
jgi:hypothetical protein